MQSDTCGPSHFDGTKVITKPREQRFLAKGKKRGGHKTNELHGEENSVARRRGSIEEGWGGSTTSFSGLRSVSE